MKGKEEGERFRIIELKEKNIFIYKVLIFKVHSINLDIRGRSYMEMYIQLTY